MPTIAELTGQRIEEVMVSPCPALLGDKQTQHDVLYWGMVEAGGSPDVERCQDRSEKSDLTIQRTILNRISPNRSTLLPIIPRFSRGSQG